MNDALTLKIVMPDGSGQTVACESVTLTVCDGKDGKGAGSYGIRQGHAAAVIALEHGPVCAKSGGKEVFSAVISGGFALVENNTVTVTAESVK